MTSATGNPALCAVLAAAGVGTRMQSTLAKQYLPLLGQRVIDWSLQRLLQAGVSEVVVVVSEDDCHWPGPKWQADSRVSVTFGAHSRALSVTNGLRYLLARKQNQPVEVMVHDAARPCVQSAQIQQLIDAVTGSADGGLLAQPVSDTLKLADGAGRCGKTLDRRVIWRAATPQLFDAAQLLQALERCAADKIEVTDEASAMEYCGFHPQLIPCGADNFKITQPGDIDLAEYYLRLQEARCE